MAKAFGRLRLPEGGFQAGLIGDMPIDAAIAAVQEGRMKFDYSHPAEKGLGIPLLLSGLGVESLAELAELVKIGREHRYCFMGKAP